MIGKIVKIRTPYFDSVHRTTRFKSRPGLVIGNYGLIDSDYIVLPISKVSDSRMIHPLYDLPIDPNIYTLSNLTSYSYIRCHKQAIIHRADISGEICDFKSIYPDMYIKAVGLLEKFDNVKIGNAL